MSGCSSTLGTMGYERFYYGGLKPLSDVAIIATKTESMGENTTCFIDYIDGKSVKRAHSVGKIFKPSIRELNPGKHKICVSYQKTGSVAGRTYTGQHSKGCVEAIFDVKPGHVYLIYPKIILFNNSWEPKIWDITSELHSPTHKDLVSEIDETFAKNRGANSSVSILSLSKNQNTFPLVGFGEKRKSNLKKWLNKDITVTYKFYRYNPVIIAKADDGIKYHLEIDQKTGNVMNTLGKDVFVERGYYPAFQPLGSKFAYTYRLKYKNGQPIWEEQKDSSFIRIK